MNTVNNRNEKNQRRETRQKQEPKKQSRKTGMLNDNLNVHEQERIETRMTR
jgi:hypothetical protein